MRAEPYTEAALRAAGALDDAPSVAPGIDAGRIGRGDVLMLRALGLGDGLTGIAPIRGLRRLYPGHRLVLAAPPEIGGLLAHHGVVDAVLPTPGLVPLEQVDGGHVAVDLHGRGPESRRLLADGDPARLIGFDCPELGLPGPSWVRDEHEVDRWCRVVREAGGPCDEHDLRLRSPEEAAAARRPDAPVIVHPGAASGSRRWPVERWTQVARALAADGHRILVTGSDPESALGAALARDVPSAADLTGTLDLGGLYRLVARSAAVLSGDTGIAHLATALATPSVVLFGPVPPRWWGPRIDPDLHTVLWHGDPDAETWGDPHGETVDTRLDEITVDEVLDTTRDLLAATGRTFP